ncbi:unnamed protein product [Parajaminaea phylloscopi]
MAATETSQSPPRSLSDANMAGDSGAAGPSRPAAGEMKRSHSSGGSKRHGSASSTTSNPVRRQNALNPAFGMTTSTDAGPSRSPHNDGSTHTANGRRPSRDAGSAMAGSKVKRNHKSSDRLHRLGGGGTGSSSSTHLAGKRSKSHTNLAQGNDTAAHAHAQSSSNQGKGHKKKASSGRRGGSGSRAAAEEEGWTSASAESETPEASRSSSPQQGIAALAIEDEPPHENGKPPWSAKGDTAAAAKHQDPSEDGDGNADGDEDGDEDEGLTIGVHRNSRARGMQRLPSSRSDAKRDGSSSSTATARAHVVNPGITRSDTSSTLVGVVGREESREAPQETQLQQSAGSPDPHAVAVHSYPTQRTNSDDTLAVKMPSSEVAARTVSSPPVTPSVTDKTPDSQLQQRVGHEGPASLGATAPRHGHLRVSSSASNRTVTGSPASISSKMSARSRPHSLLPREHHAAAPPMLSIHNALAGNLGALQEDQQTFPVASPSKRKASFGVHPSASEPFSLTAHGGDGDRLRRKASISSQTSVITLPAGQAIVGGTNASAAGRKSLSGTNAAGTEQGGEGSQSPSGWERRRTESTRSLTAGDAARLAAKLRQARDAIDEQRGLVAGKGSSAAASNGRPLDGRQSKPVISIFGKAHEMRGKPLAVTVASSSVFSPDFTRAVAQQSESSRGQTRQPLTSRPSQQGQARTKAIRYVGNYGLSGPPIEKTPLNDALLAPSFDGDEFEASWAPALANAAGLGARSFSRTRGGTEAGGGHVDPYSSGFLEDGTPFQDPALAFGGSAAVNGPNATPVHLIHGLTAISAEPFPLDAADAPSFQQSQYGEGYDPHSAMLHGGGHGLMADPGTLRAIALTSQVLSTHRSHSMTRRFFDPMTEGLDRAFRASSRGVLLANSTSSTSSNRPNSGGAVGGRKTAPSSPRGSGSGGPGSHPLSGRTNSASKLRQGGRSHSNVHLFGLGVANSSDSPVKSLKRVWSSGGAAVSRSGSGTGSAAATEGQRRD